jgi:hypothetical protein
MANRIITWFIFTVLFAFIPVFISVLFNFLLGSEKQPYEFLNELLFFTIMISSTALNDTITLRKTMKDYVLSILIGCFILFVVWSAVLYGGVLFSQLNNVGYVSFSNKAFVFALGFAILSFVIGLIIQVMLGRSEVH